MNSQDQLKENGIITNLRNIDGDGLVEAGAVVYGKLNARFFIGAYSLIDSGTFFKNCFMGRFSVIEKNCHIGYPEIKLDNFSNHFFARNLPFPAQDDYLKSIRTSRYYYEQNKYTFIGSDVLIGKGCIIQEGVTIGDGAIVLPGSYVTTDIPPYAVASGSPAKILRFRFDKDIAEKFLKSKWWKYDISPILKDKKARAIDYHEALPIIETVISGNLPKLESKITHINTAKGLIESNIANQAIVGPSHIERWYIFSQNRKVNKPNGYHLLPIPALSLFSDQLKKLVNWWSEWLGDVLLFVPDFRIGNVATENAIKDGRLIKPEIVSDENSRKCYELGLSSLDYFGKLKCVKFWFWCLNGREEFNKSRGMYVNESGLYRHPVWNYSDLIERYKESSIDIREYFPSVLDLIVDGSIHPTHDCYEKMCKIFESIKNRIPQNETLRETPNK